LQLHWNKNAPTLFREASEKEGAEQLQDMFRIELLNQGVYSAHRGMIVPSTPMTEKEVDSIIEAIGNTLDILKPGIEESWPHLLVG